MAKTSIIQREKKRAVLKQKYALKYLHLKTKSCDMSVPEDERIEARIALQKLPRNANPTRTRNRCGITGRPRGNYRKFGMCRNMLRIHAMKGEIPGLVKASW